MSIENSFQSKGNKNFVLKFDFLNNTNNPKKNPFNFDHNMNGFNQKKFSRHTTDQEDEIVDNNRDKNSLENISDKDIDIHMFHNNNIFNETNENSRINKSKNNHSNNLQEHHQSTEDNIDSMNNHFSNMNLSNNEPNEHYTFGGNNLNLNYFNGNSMNINGCKDIPLNIQTNNQDNKNYTNIDPALLKQNTNNNMNPIIFANSFNKNGQNLYYHEQNNLNNNKRKEEILIESCETLCKEQLQCRQLQKLIDDDPSISSTLLYDKIKDKVQEISFDQFGNYFIQKVIEHLKEEQIKELLYKKISQNFRSFCFNQHGTRVIQKIFEKIIDNDELLNYYNILLTPNLKDFVVDQNASHIIIKYVNMLPYPKNDFIIKFLVDNSFEFATKKHSCCVLQKCIEYSNQQQKKEFLKAISVKSYGLFNDQYGNYVVQYCINLCDYEINKIFVNNFLSDIMKFSTQKYSSNIIEKCMDCCDEDTRELIVEKYYDTNIIENLLFDMYGNYVLQKIISLSKEPFTSKYFSIIGPLMNKLNLYSFGQKLYNKLLSSFPDLSNYIEIKNEIGKIKKFQSKTNKTNKNNNTKDMDGFIGNMNSNNMDINVINNMKMYNNGNNNPKMKNFKNNKKNKNIQFSNNQMFAPRIDNIYIPFQLNNNMNPNNNNIYFQYMINNYPINFNAQNNMNNYIQFFHQMNNNNIASISNDSTIMFNYNKQ